MQKKALAIIDIQNDITKNYKDIIDNINKTIDWAGTDYDDSKNFRRILFSD